MKLLIKLSLFLSVVTFAEEPTVMTLRSILANDSLLFSYKQSYFNCYPYGVLVLEKLVTNKKVSSTCKKEYFHFTKRHPKLYFFAHYHFHIEQNYILELKKEGCVIFSKGKKTYSEALLEKGLAIVDPQVKNEEYDRYLFDAQERAKKTKRGLWDDRALRKCKAELLR